MIRAAILAVLIALSMQPGPAQTTYSRSRRGSSPKTTGVPGANRTLAGTFRGKLKQLSSKEIVVETGEDQVVAIRRSKKTKFYKDGKEVKASEIAAGSLVSVDATEDVDLKPIAVSVTADKV